VEVLIVVLIIGVLAALVVPQFSNAAKTAKESTLRDDLRHLRTQIMVYRAQHGNVSPGFPNGDPSATPTDAAFVAQMTQYTDGRGRASANPDATHKLGPYLTDMPVNPINDSASIRFIGPGQPFPSAPVGSEGWVYQPSTGAISANVDGEDSSGAKFFEY
jgi:general secretion pathway protein G